MSLTELLNIEYPIFQGGMARIATHALAGPVSEAGGLGILASAGWTPDKLREEIRLTREITEKPFAVNLMLQDEDIDALIDVVIEEGVKIVVMGAGNPAPYMERLHENDIKPICIIAAVKHAKKMEQAGAVAVIAEGQEAGGHIGATSSMSLIPQIADAVDIPVIGAGGVGDGRSVAAMFALGAQGVQAGTLFILSEECPAPQSYKEAIINAVDTDTIVTGRSMRAPVRSLKNEMLTKVAQLEYEGDSQAEIEEYTVGSLARAAFDGDMETGSAMAGEISGLLKEIKPAKQIIEDLFREADEVIANLKIER